MVDSLVATAQIGVIGACWYLEPERFLTLTDRFLRNSIGSGHLERRFVSMKKSFLKQDSKGGDAIAWLFSEGPFLDISAYALACATLPENLSLYLVFNDTLFTKHPWRLISHRLAGVRDSVASFSAPAASAEIHPSTDLLLIDSHNPSRRHLSTFCLLLNNAGFQIFRQLLGRLPSSSDSEVVQNWIRERIGEYPVLRSLLHVHLYGPRSPWSWKHNAPALLDRKAVTVIFEYILTVELLARGLGIPINQGFGYRFYSRFGRHG